MLAAPSAKRGGRRLLGEEPQPGGTPAPLSSRTPGRVPTGGPICPHAWSRACVSLWQPFCRPGFHRSPFDSFLKRNQQHRDESGALWSPKLLSSCPPCYAQTQISGCPPAQTQTSATFAVAGLCRTATAFLLQQEATTLATAVTQGHAPSPRPTPPGRVPGGSRAKPGCRVLLPGALQLSVYKEPKSSLRGRSCNACPWLSPGRPGNPLAQLDNARLVSRLGRLWH